MQGMTLPDEDLLQQVISLTYHQLVADARRHDRPPTAQRFVSQAGLEQAREEIVKLCDEEGVDSTFAEFVSTQWLRQFDPLLM
jgi:hypothetical protein